jgi:hypothetical protein
MAISMIGVCVLYGNLTIWKRADAGQSELKTGVANDASDSNVGHTIYLPCRDEETSTASIL